MQKHLLNAGGLLGTYYTALMGRSGLMGYIFAIVPTVLFLVTLSLILIDKVFGKKGDKNRKIHMVFLGRVMRVIVVILAVLAIFLGYGGFPKLVRLLTGSTLVLGGVLGIAAQDIIKDILAGFMLSFYQPFDLGDRLIVPDVIKPGIVEDLTMRHTVLRAMDGMRFIIPNSKMNDLIIQHTSYAQKPRATYLNVPISYDTDIRLAIALMRKAVKNCPYTCPGNSSNTDLEGYGDVYLYSIGASAFLLNMTIWSEPDIDNDLAVSEAYQAIIKEFNDYGVEMPYDYINVIDAAKAKEEMESADKKSIVDELSKQERKRLGRRMTKVRTDRVFLGKKTDFEAQVVTVAKKASKFSKFNQMDSADTNVIAILSEELLNFAHLILGDLSGAFWLEGTGTRVEIHLKENASANLAAKEVLLDLSSEGVNAANMNFVQKVRQVISLYSTGREQDVSFSLDEMVDDDDLEKTIITKLSDDVRVSLTEDSIHITIIWKKDMKKGK